MIIYKNLSISPNSFLAKYKVRIGVDPVLQKNLTLQRCKTYPKYGYAVVQAVEKYSKHNQSFVHKHNRVYIFQFG